MRIALDATPLTLATGGLRRYLVELTRGLARAFPGDELHLLTDQSAILFPPEWDGLPNVVVSAGQATPGRRRWWSMGLPLQLALRDIDVFHGVNFSVPYVPVRPAVMTVLDLSPWKTGPARATTAARIRRRTKQLFPVCNKIITPTEAIRRELHGQFGVPLSRIETVHLAPHPELRAPAASEASLVLRKYSIARPFLLYFGARNPRKNLDALIAAWRRARAAVSGLSLVLAGSPDQEPDNLKETEGPRIIENIPDNEILALLSTATAFVYPSLYEGFGLPVLEAMQAGAPVVASLDPAITEVAGGAALQVDCGSIPALSRALADVAARPGLRDELRRRGLRRAAQFSWNSTALQTHAVYEQAIRRH